jgi:hypothetical protein
MSQFYVNHCNWNLDQELDNMLDKIKIKIGQSDSFDYNEFMHFVDRYNLCMSELSKDIAKWKVIFMSQQTITPSTMERNIASREADKQLCKITVQEYMLQNYFMSKNVV